MIYVCVAARNDATTVGLLLWKIRQVFADTTREYQLLVADDASTDETPDVLKRYQQALPLAIVSTNGSGSAAVHQALLEEAVRRSDRVKRDAAVLIPGDFRISPEGIPELLRRIESGADLVVAETPADGLPWKWRLLRRLVPWLLRPGVKVDGVHDLLSGFVAVRLVCARGALQDRGGEGLLESDGLPARAELVARLGATARQVVPVTLAGLPQVAGPAVSPLTVALELRRLGKRVRIAPHRPAPVHARPARRRPGRSRAS
jgi:hypothetical protein